MKVFKKFLVLLCLSALLVLLSGCGQASSAFDRPAAGVGEANLAAGDKAMVEAAAAANEILLGKGISARGKTLYLKQVPLSVRESELAQALPHKELLALYLRYQALPSPQDIADELDLSVDESSDATAIIAMNNRLQSRAQANLLKAWREDLGPIERLRGKERTEEDFQAFLEKKISQNKTRVKLLR